MFCSSAVVQVVHVRFMFAKGRMQMGDGDDLFFPDEMRRFFFPKEHDGD